MATLPDEIVSHVLRLQKEWGWPEEVPAFPELPNGLFTTHEALTVGDCEQIVEWRIRLARRWINKFLRDRLIRSAVKAAGHILYARLYRCQYLTLIGKTDSTENDLPFPVVNGQLIDRRECDV